MAEDKSRPYFPKRAVVTGGMPYGEKLLHFGHIGGMYIHADVYARFLRDRLGKENVIFVSGTDCYGAGPEVKFRQEKQNGYNGTIEDFIESNHKKQKEMLNTFGISLDLFAASGLGEAKDTHRDVSARIFNLLYDNGYLRIDEVLQFYDEESETFLNGRQVEGRCPLAGCKSEVAYADECALGHQYSPEDLIAPIGVTTGKTPVLKPIKNWYFNLERFSEALKKRQIRLKNEGRSRRILLRIIDEFLRAPSVLVKTEDFEALRGALTKCPAHNVEFDEERKSAVLTFKALKEREKACAVLRENGFRFRTGTTLVPFRLSGNVSWGIPVPEREGITERTFWVWPESLWAPVSFVKTYLKQTAKQPDDWKKWWLGPDAHVYQFIGEDNIYFYAIAEMGMFMALDEAEGREAGANLPTIIPNRHVFYGNKKAASSGKLKPPSIAELLEHYTAEQLRMHFAHMALHLNSVSFVPKAIMEEKDGFDQTLAEGNILTNIYNRLIRSCFYTMQKYFDGCLPDVGVSDEIQDISKELVFEYEWAMYKFEFSRVIDLIDVYLRDASRVWALNSKEAESTDDNGLRAKTLSDTFHVVRIAATLLHPIAPWGTQKVRDYLNIDERLWDWAYIDKPLSFFTDAGHSFKFLEPRVDFFAKHESQLKQK